MDKITIGLFSLVNFLHIFKFMWGPILEKISFFSFSRYGYKICLIVSLLGCSISLYYLTYFNPVDNFLSFAFCLIILSLFSSIYSMLIQSSQILLIHLKHWGVSEAACTTGFRLGILAAGSGGLYLSTIMPWKEVYQIMAISCFPPLLLIICYSFNLVELKLPDESKFRQALIDFINKPKWFIIVIFLLIYRLQDNFLSVMPNMFYLDLGYSKTALAFGYKALGMLAAVIGGFLGGYLCRKYEYGFIFKRVLVYHALSGIPFLFLFYINKTTMSLYLIVFIHEFTKGLTLSPFFAYQLKCCTSQYCITQIALLTSIASISQILLGSISGYSATYLGWPLFFIFSSLGFIPAYKLIKYLPK